MRDRYLEVTFRKGRPLAAYYYLPRSAGTKSVRTEAMAPGLLVDYAADGTPIGIEITDPMGVTLDLVNMIMQRLGLGDVAPEELRPLRAA